MKQWWVITYATKQYEKIIETIEREKFAIEIYCPMVKKSITRKGLVKFEQKPLMFNYMFWKYDKHIEELTYMELSRYINFRILSFSGKDCTISSKEIRRIKRLVTNRDADFELIRTNPRKLRKYIGKMVLVKDGVFNGMTGKITGVGRAGKLDIELSIFNRPITCDISLEYVEFV